MNINKDTAKAVNAAKTLIKYCARYKECRKCAFYNDGCSVGFPFEYKEIDDGGAVEALIKKLQARHDNGGDLALTSSTTEEYTKALKTAMEVISKHPLVTYSEPSEYPSDMPVITSTIDQHIIAKGEWITQEGYDGDEYYECSVCKDAFVLMEGTPKENNYNFCPNCGAKMYMKGGAENG